MLRRKQCRDSTSTPPLRSNLSFTRRRVNLAQTPSATWLVFPRTRLFCIEEKRRVANPEHARPEIPAIFFESGSAETRSKPQREFSQSLLASFSSGRHLGCPRGQTALPTVARCTVAMWTDGRSARPLTWARRTQVRVFARTQPHATPYASMPRLPESAPSASHSASLPCRDPGSDADLPPSARRPRRRGPARRVHRTRGRRVPHAVGVPAGTRTARTRAFAKRVTKTRDDFVFGVFSTTALTTFSSPSRRRVAVETPTTRFLTTTHTD